MDMFVTWESLAIFGSLVTINFSIVEFIKELPLVRLLKTEYLSWVIAFALITITNLVLKSFVATDMILYAISAIFISTSGNGISVFNNHIDKRTKVF